MKTLRYLIVIGLPEQEEKLLAQNLRAEGEQSRGCRVFFYRSSEARYFMESGRLVTEEGMPATGEGMPAADESLLVSGEPDWIHFAVDCQMASLCYLAPGTEGETDVAADMYAEGFEEIGWVFLRHVYERHHHLPWTILETERCVVKEFSMEYLPALFELYAGDGMTDYIEPLYEYEKEKEYQQAYIETMYRFYGYGMWIVCEKETGKLIGRVGLEHREALCGEPELGYVIGVPYQKQGYATEVCRAVLRYAGEELGFSHVCCLIEAGNEASVHLAKKLGFSCCGEMELDGKRMMKYVTVLLNAKNRCIL